MVGVGGGRVRVGSAMGARGKGCARGGAAHVRERGCGEEPLWLSASPRVRQARKKVVKIRGAFAGVAPGGDGFECPASGCKSVFDTAEEALEHGATHGLSGAREVDDEGHSCCLWQGCSKKLKVVCPSKPKGDFKPLRAHEALHTKGPKPREGFVCRECDEAYPTSAAAWACAATHDVEENPKECLWAGCGLVFKTPGAYRAHEPVRRARSRARRRGLPRRPARVALPPAPASVASLGLPSHARTPRRVAGAHGTLAVPLHHVQQGPQAARCALSRITPLRRPANETPHPSPALSRVRDALLQGHRRVQVRLDRQGVERPE